MRGEQYPWLMTVVVSCLSFAIGAYANKTLADRKDAVQSGRSKRAETRKKREPAKLQVPRGNTENSTQALAPMKLGHLNMFLSWDCSHALLSMGLFPNAAEISESMACLRAVDNHLALRFTDPDVLCIVVGDGVMPRTATLLAMRTKWRRILSVDPALPGAAFDAQQDGSISEPRWRKGAQKSERAIEKRRQQIELLSRIDRLEMRADPIQQVVVDVAPGVYRHVVILLPHAHVVPDVALAALRLDPTAIAAGDVPVISVVQLPCCSFVKHDTVCNTAPDNSFIDDCICSADARTVRIWKDVSANALALNAVWVGDRRPLTDQLVAGKRKVQRDVAKAHRPNNLCLSAHAQA